MASSDDMDIEQDITLTTPEIPGKRRVLVDADELATLRAWNERAVPLLTALAEADLIERDGWEACHFCEWDGNMKPAELGHEATCPIIQARALLAESEASDAE